MKRCLFFLSLIFLPTSFVFADNMPIISAKDHFSDLSQTMRKLWSDHVIWTRQFIVSSVLNSPDAPIAAARLLKNQEDIGNSLLPYYDKEAAASLTKLLKEHILIAADLTKASIAKKNDEMALVDKKWHENAVAIADFLSSANPYLAKNDLLTMLNEHLTLTSNEVMLRINKKWQEDVTNFDKIFDQALNMADTLSNGIKKQFPNVK